MSYKILSTKKLKPSLHQQLKQNDFVLMEEDFINIQPIVTETIIKKLNSFSANDVLVFTSTNAVNVVKDHINTNERFRICCINGNTKQAVSSTFKNAEILAAADYGKDLAEKIIAAKIRQVTFFCSNIRRNTLPNLLQQNNIAVEEIVVYNTIENPKQIDTFFNAVLFFSPSAVRSFFSSNTITSFTTCFAIGTTTANEIKQFANNEIIIPDAPSQEAIISKLINHFKQAVQS